MSYDEEKFGVEVLLNACERQKLGEIVEFLKPRVSVEIGSWMGGSAIYIAPHSERLFCVDIWGDYVDKGGFDKPVCFDYKETGFGSLSSDEKFELFCSNVNKIGLGLFEKVFPCRGPSVLWSKVWSIPIDFLFIDGCHTYENVKEDILGWRPHVRKGGLIMGHDYLLNSLRVDGFVWEFPGVAKAVHECFENVCFVPGTSFWMVSV